MPDFLARLFLISVHDVHVSHMSLSRFILPGERDSSHHLGHLADQLGPAYPRFWGDGNSSGLNGVDTVSI